MQHFLFWRCFDFSFSCSKPIRDLLRITRITSQEPPAKPADWVPDRLDPVKFSLMDLQGLAERLRLEDSCHGKHLKVLEIHRCCFLVLGCFHDAPGVLNNNYIHSMTDLLVLLVYGGAGHMAVRCWRSSN